MIYDEKFISYSSCELALNSLVIIFLCGLINENYNIKFELH